MLEYLGFVYIIIEGRDLQDVMIPYMGLRNRVSSIDEIGIKSKHDWGLCIDCSNSCFGFCLISIPPFKHALRRLLICACCIGYKDGFDV